MLSWSTCVPADPARGAGGGGRRPHGAAGGAGLRQRARVAAEGWSFCAYGLHFIDMAIGRLNFLLVAVV